MTCATCLSPCLSGTAGNDFFIFLEPSDLLKTTKSFSFIKLSPLASSGSLGNMGLFSPITAHELNKNEQDELDE
jgi:hypothetical protein